MLTVAEIAKMIDHSLLRPEMNSKTVREGLLQARELHTASVCVRPGDVALATEILKGSDVPVCTVIGFPHGSNTTAVKVFESEQAMNEGAVELDMVLNIGRLLSGDFEYVEKDIRAVVEAAHKRNAIVKVILENCYLDDALKVEACKICERAGADFVKTSTGFGTSGSTKADLVLMRGAVSDKVQVKAAGGIRTLDALLEAREAGASRVGATASAQILAEAAERVKNGTLK